MTKGILLYAFNNEVTDYEAIAEWSAKRIKKYLGLPTTIITDKNAIAEFGGSRIMHPTQNRELATWFNAGRFSCSVSCNASMIALVEASI